MKKTRYTEEQIIGALKQMPQAPLLFVQSSHNPASLKANPTSPDFHPLAN